MFSNCKYSFEPSSIILLTFNSIVILLIIINIICYYFLRILFRTWTLYCFFQKLFDKQWYEYNDKDISNIDINNINKKI